MANYTVQLKGNFDYTQVLNGIKEIKKQISSIHLGDDIAKELQSSLEKIDIKIPKIENFLNKDQLSGKELEKLQKLIREIENDINNFNKLVENTDLTKTFSSIDLSKLENLDKQIKNIQDKIQVARQELIDTFTKEVKIDTKNDIVQKAITDLFSVEPSQVKDKFQEIQTTIESQLQETENKIRNLTDDDISSGPKIIKALFGDESTVSITKGKVTEFKTQLGELVQQFKDLTPGTEEARNKLKEIFDLINNYTKNKNQEKIFQGPSPDDLKNISQLENYLEKIEELSKTKEEFFSENEAEKVKILEEKVKALEERIKNLEKLQPNLKSDIKEVADELHILGNDTDEAVQEAAKLEAQQKALDATFGGLIHRIESAVSAIAIFNKGMQITRNAIQSVKDLDAAFTQIAIVSEQSGEAAWKMFNEFNNLAKQYSITTKDLTEGAKLFYQQGLNAADTMKMVEASTVSAALGEVTMTEAANTLTAAIQGYNESASVAMDYTDKIAKVGAVSAADFNELSASMEKTASSAYTAGIDFDHLLGYLGKMIEVTREAPANLGTAMKTIIARFEDMKKDPMAILEDGVSANKVEDALKSIGIALRNTAGEFRPLQDVMDELGMKWDSLTRNQQAYIATMAAGSRQQSRFLAMMNNYGRTLDLISESQNSAGAAAQQYATYQDSIAAAQARLTASWEKLYSKIVDNDIIKFVINGLSDLLELLSHIPPSITAIGATIGALQLQQFLNDKGGLIKIITNLLGGGKEDSLKDAGIHLGQKLVNGIKEGINEYSQFGKGQSFLKSFKEMFQVEISDIGKSAGAKLTSTFTKFGDILTSIPGKITKIALALKGFALAHPVITGITVAIGVLTAAITIVHNMANKAKDDSKKTAEELSKLNEELDQTNNKLNNLENLMTSYDKLNSKLQRTEEEQQELNSIIQQIGEISDIAKISVDSYGNSHLNNVDKIKQEIEVLERYNELIAGQSVETRKDFLKNTEGMTSETASTAGETGLASALKLKENLGLTDKDIKSLKEEYNNLDSNLTISLDQQLENIVETYKISLDNTTELLGNTYYKISEQFILGTEGITEENLNEARDAYVEALKGSVSNFIKQYDEINALIEEEQSKSLQKLMMDELKNNKSIDKDTLAFLDNFDLEIADFDEYLNTYAEIIKWYKELNNLPKDQQEKYKELIKNYNAGELTETELLSKLDELGITLDDYVQGLIDTKIQDLKKEESQNRQERLGSIQRRKENLGYNLNSDQLARISGRELDFYDNISPVLSEENKEKILKEGFGANYGTDKIVSESENLVKAAAEYSWETVSETIKNITEYLKELGFSDQEANDVIAGLVPDLQDKIGQSIQQLTGTSIPNANSYTGELTTEQYQAYADKLGGYENVGLDFNEEGKVILDTFTQVDLILKDIENYNNKIDNIINAINIKLETQSDLSDEEKNILEKTIQALQDQKIEFQDVVDNTKTQIGLIKELNGEYKGVAKSAKALQFSADYAKEFKDVVDLAKEMQDQMDKMGQVDSNLMNQLLDMGAVFQDFFHVNDDGSVEMVLSEQLSQYENAAEAITDIQRKRQEVELEMKRQELNAEADVADAKAELYKATADIYMQLSNAQTEEEFNNIKSSAEAEINAKGATVENAQKKYNEIISAAEQAYTYLSQLDASFWAKLSTDEMKDFVSSTISGFRVSEGSATDILKEINGLGWNNGGRERAKELEGQYRNAEELQRNLARRLREAAKNLKIIDPVIFEDLKKKFNQTGSEGVEDIAKIADAFENLISVIEDLDKLLEDIKKDLDDITVDYNPFLDLFEAWEKEWDYYYNIKRLIAEIGTQGQFIDNIISADYISADERVQAYHAKIGNLLAQMAANDAYIEALRAGMSQTAVELMKDYGDYYKVDPTTGQIYQTDKNLTDINKTINQTGEEIYNLQKLQNEKENDLALENAKLEALEQEKSAYEEILSVIEDQLDSLKDNEDITVNLSELESKRDTIKADIELSEESIETTKDRIEKMEDEIQEIEVQITLKEQTKSDLEKYVDDMENKVSEYEQYWENLNSTIAEQQELLQSLNDIYATYVDTAVSTQQELYDAIVENYQKEIDEKKKEYDELKRLDNDYLNSVKDNISKEREARDDSKKQKSYQQSIQRAQLLQMDTSGAYRTELANLKNTIEDQRQELYDDLVDKQVKALEKEIEERHKLYDKEVEALEQRLAYYQENAILLWEMVNTIVAEGSSNMMAILEGTIEYINSNELSKQQQRETWENNVKMTFDGVKNGTIDMLNSLIQAGNNYITQELPEINKSLDEYNQVFINASETMSNYNAQVLESLNVLRDDTRLSSETFKSILNSFMTTWNARTNEFTGYAKNWKSITDSLKTQTENNITKLKEFFDSEGEARKDNIGSIKKYNKELEKTYTKVYEDFITERNNYRDELETLVERIRIDIEAAIKDAANAIRNAANSISANTGGSDPGNNGGGGSPTDPGNGPGSNNPGGGEEPKYEHWKAWFNYNDGSTPRQVSYGVGKKVSTSELYNNWLNYLKILQQSKPGATSWGLTYYAKGGLANFTGPAWLDGTKSTPERILSPHQTKLFESMVSSLERASNNSNINSTLGSSYNIGDINTSIQVAKLDNQTDINKLAKQVEDKIVNTIRNRVVVSM